MAKKSNRKSNINDIKTHLEKSEVKLEDGIFHFIGPMTINEFSKRITKTSNEIITYFFKKGILKNINTTLNEEEIAELCLEFGWDFVKSDNVNAQNVVDSLIIDTENEKLETRPAIVTIMGHVDHGKTTLIDKIRKSDVISSEFGGITQHTGAYQVKYDEKYITFLDTPGHEAFTEMRSRGAKVTDIVVLVVAADDGVKPQTIEAIDHSKAANVPIIVFVNKMDKPNKDVEKLKSQLSESDIVSEEWGGDVQFVYGSALTGEGIEKLFEAIFLQAEILDLKAVWNREAIGTIIESRLDKGKGVVATLIVENGTLLPRDFIVAGSQYGKIRSLTDTEGNDITFATPGMPCVITGLNSNPQSGDKFVGISDEKFAKKLAEEKKFLDKQKELNEKNIQLTNTNEKTKIINVIVKTDVQGTAEAIKNTLINLTTEEVSIKIIRATIGDVTKADVALASTCEALIYGFNVNINESVKSYADSKNIVFKNYNVIYKIVEELTHKIKGFKEPVYEEVQIAEAVVLQIFFYSKIGQITGAKVVNGKVKANAKVEVIRRNKVIYKGVIDSLKREKNDAKSVDNGFEFGTHIKDFNDIQVDDILRFYEDVLVEDE
ncbi:translation initiation factor IF-2 [Mycoplasma miroungirhinis]|uniref:Translation initiation factor IF-2 n=1 Tax=Mycoplasma miroungirhinis TaxID=754516 RepID=A0A6M4JBA5_9MOLU|nr:translation initiation factor IF-2 [Mycoplasma miroungirhinis]QJR44274.1 translation initiation factor IF-2 [Mycoplasma miroungirhinis]